MSPLRSHLGLLGRCIRLAAIVLTLHLLSHSAYAEDEALLLDVQVNGHSIGKVGEFTLRDGNLFASRAELRDLGFRVPVGLASRDAATPASDELVPLSAIPLMKWNIDQPTQTLYITVPASQLLPTVLEVNTHEHPMGRFQTQTGTGFTANYDIAGTSTGGQNGVSGSLDMRAFFPAGIVSSGLLLYAGTPQGATGTSHAIRLDTTYSYADTNSMRRYSVGDFISGGLSWTRPVRLLGAQLRSDYSMRPDMVTFPVPSIDGAVAVPSTISVLTDGRLIMSQEVNPGPFQTPQLPVVTGAGNISLKVTDAMGQQVTVNQPFYASSSLLIPGLKTFSAQAGLVRRNWGVDSGNYGALAATAEYRRGITSKATVEASMEATDKTVMGGGGGVLQVGHLGTVNVALAGSSGSPGQGGLLSVGAQRLSRVFSLTASATVATKDFQDVAAINGDPYPTNQFNVSTGITVSRFASIGVAYASIRNGVSTTLGQPYAGPAETSSVLSASFSFQLRHAAFYANEFKDFGANASNGIQVGLSIPLGRRKSAGLSVSSDGSTQTQVQQAATRVGEWGYQTYNSTGQSNHQFAQAQFKTPWSLLTAGVDRDAGVNSFRLESQGAISFVDKSFFPSNTIYDSFAIVDTNHLAHVSVLQENREVGSTNSAGRLLVSDLRSFELNHLAVYPGDIPADISIDTTTREVRPQDRTGIVVKFRTKVSHGALLRLVDEAGVPIPVGSRATLDGSETAVPVGFDGEAYMEDLKPHNEVAIEFVNGHHCTVLFDYHGVPGDIPVIGPLPCREKRQ